MIYKYIYIFDIDRLSNIILNKFNFDIIRNNIILFTNNIKYINIKKYLLKN